MKKYFFLTVVTVMFLSLTACNEAKKSEEKVEEKTELEVIEEAKEETQEEIAMATYQCPMKCEGEKTYQEAGSCPVCTMEIKEVKLEVTE